MEVEESAALDLRGNCAAQGPRALCSAGATVAVFNEGTEAPVVGQQQWEVIHDLHSRGRSISAIARELGLDRKTVRTCLSQPSWQPYRRSEAASLLDPHRQWIASRAPEVNYSARILWQELRSHRGFTGSYVIVRRAVAPLRLAATVTSLTQRRFETGPGEQAQCVGNLLLCKPALLHRFSLPQPRRSEATVPLVLTCPGFSGGTSDT